MEYKHTLAEILEEEYAAEKPPTLEYGDVLEEILRDICADEIACLRRRSNSHFATATAISYFK